MKSMFIVTGSLGNGGIEKVTSRIANYYVDKGYNVTICCLFGGEDKVFVTLNENIEVLFFDGAKENSKAKVLMAGKWIRFLRDAFKKRDPDFVLSMTLKIGALCVLARKRMDIRISFRETCDPKTKVRSVLFDRLLCRICKKIDGIIFQTEWEKSCYPQYMQDKGRVIPNPVSVDVLWEYNPENKNIVTMGRLDNIQKRHDILIEAFNIFSKRNAGYNLVLYGEGPDKEYDEKLAKKYGLEKSVIFAGAKKGVHNLIRDASMFVMTSDFEGLSNALAEAMVMGIPCISSDWPGCSEVITHNVNGYIYTRQNVEELAAYMDDLANNEQKKLSFSSEAQKLRFHFDPKPVIDEYAKVIEGKR